MCSLSSIEDAFTTSAQEIVADSLGATPALTESGGVIAGEETGVRIATIFFVSCETVARFKRFFEVNEARNLAFKN